MNLWEFLESKGQEYAPFDPRRAHRIYAKLAPKLHIENLKVIHLVGTNGKGSTGRFIALGLMQQGYKVLHFSSPHLWHFRERFFTHTGEVCDQTLQQAHEFLQQQDFVNEASYFEYATFLALYIAQGYDFLVLEAGLGGEFDSTSVIVSDLSVFTPIGFDHKDFLGTSIESIAGTKLRVMGKNVIMAPQHYPQCVSIAYEIAKDYHARIFALECIKFQTQYNVQYEKFCLTFGLQNTLDSSFWQGYADYVSRYHLAEFLAQNLLVASFALQFFGIKIDFLTLPALNLHGRCEWLAPHIVLDVGHNQECARALKSVIEQNFKQRRVILVYNTYSDKEVHCILELLKPHIQELWIFPLTHNPRVIVRDVLVAILEDLGIAYRDFVFEDMTDSKEYVVFGSFSVVAGFLDIWREKLCKIN